MFSLAATQMARPSRVLDSVRDLLDVSEAVDVALTGGAVLHDEDVGLYTDALLRELQGEFHNIEIEHVEPTTNGVILDIRPADTRTAVLLSCKKYWHIVKTVHYDTTHGRIIVTFPILPQVRFCSSLAWIILVFAASAVCYYLGTQTLPVVELVAALS
jgi:hypothetical protein